MLDSYYMNYRELVRTASRKLKKAGVPKASLEAEILLSHSTGQPKESILTHPEMKAGWVERFRFCCLVSRRCRREPMAYILRHKEFCGREFVVNSNVLIPRPETETLVEAALSNAKCQMPNVAIFDIGTGSGAIGLTLAAELSESRAVLTDVSRPALRIARKNAERLDVTSRTEFKLLDILDPTATPPCRPSGFLVIVANLPYLSESHLKETQPEISRYEPTVALASGSDGLKHYRALIDRLAEWNFNPDLLLIEADPNQFSLLEKLIRNRLLPDYQISIRKDLSGNARILVAQKT